MSGNISLDLIIIIVLSVALFLILIGFIVWVFCLSKRNKKLNDMIDGEVSLDQGTALSIINKRLDEVNSKIQSISSIETSMKSIKDVFLKNKNRGELGEFSLETILQNILGSSNSKIWDKQVTLKGDESNNIIDFIIRVDDKLKIGIDSKFPVENYLKIINEENKDIIRNQMGEFRNIIIDIVKSVDKKYMNKDGITTILIFIPSENIFNFIIDNYYEIVNHASNRSIHFCSPGNIGITLMSFKELNSKYKIESNIKNISDKLRIIKTDMEKWNVKYLKLKKSFENIYEINFKDVDNSQLRLLNSMNNILEVNLEDKDLVSLPKANEESIYDNQDIYNK